MDILMLGVGALAAWGTSWAFAEFRRRQTRANIARAYAEIKRSNAKADRLRDVRYMSPEAIAADFGVYKRDTLRSAMPAEHGPFYCGDDGEEESES